MSTPVPVASLEVGSQLGKFLLMRILGEGGMGMVWLAEDTSLGRNVALKVIRPEFAFRDDVRDRFIQEARSAAKVKHDRIVGILEIGEDRKVPYIAMELLEGEDLFKHLTSEPVPPLPFTLKVIAQVLQGLSAAHTHANKLIHRDIKPQNVWLETVEGKAKFRCKILDFGIAKTSAEDRLKTQTGMIIGTLDYMSPEQLNADELDPRSDLFSVGVMLYQMLTGDFPYHSRMAYRGMEMQTTKPVNPSELNPQAPQALSDFALRLMAVNRDDRPASAKEALELLDAIIKNPRATPSRLESMPVPSQPVFEPPPNEAEIAPTAREGVKFEEASPPPLRSGRPRPAAMKPRIELRPEPMRIPPPAPEWAFEETGSRVDQRTVVPPPERRRVWIVALVLGVTLIGVVLFSLGEGGLSGGGSSSKAPVVKGEGEKKGTPPEVVKGNSPVEKKAPVLPTGKEPERLDCTGPSGADEATVKRIQKAWADHLGVPVETTVDLGGGVKMEFVLVPPGKFQMGAPESEQASLNNERPLHPVTLTKPFYLGKYEVTQGEYTQLTGLPNPSNFANEPTSPRHPVERVSWDEVKTAADKLSGKSLPKGFSKASLPAEAQWEYACRAGTRTPFHFGDVLNGDKANCDGDDPYGTTTKGQFLQRTVPVDSKDYLPNALGLHHMHGNVLEWCLDGYDASAYKANGRIDPFTDYSNRNRRILRGGSWNTVSSGCRSANRYNSAPEYRNFVNGFRLILLQ